MALISLELFMRLEIAASRHEDIALNTCYNRPGDSSITPEDFMLYIKRAKQALALFDNLDDLYWKCDEVLKGNIQLFIDHKYAEDETGALDPFKLLTIHFDSGKIDELPEDINQYQELVAFISNLGSYEAQAQKALGWDDEEAINSEILAISLEYCLDGYNQFYQQCRALIDLHKLIGTIRPCAQAILDLYSPFKID